MLKTIRRVQKGILVVVAAIIIIAFAWLYNRQDYSQPGLMEVFSVYGRAYRISEAQKLMRTLPIAVELGFSEFARTLFGEQRQDDDRTDYAIGLIVLRKEAARLGIAPSQEEVSALIKKLPPFQTGGSYDPKQFEAYQADRLTPNGFTLNDLRQLVSDYLSFERIQQLLRANMHASPAVVNEQFEQIYSNYNVSRVDFPRATQSENIDITPEEIKAYYETHKDALLADPKRRIAYVFFPLPEGIDELPEEERSAGLRETGAKVQGFVEALVAESVDFDAVAKAQGIEVMRPAEFSAADPPEELKNEFQLVSAVFQSTLGNPIGEPIRTAKGFYVFNLLAVIEPQPLSLEEATAQIQDTLRDSKIAAKLHSVGEDARKKIAAALEDGKSFAVAAKEAGIEAKEIPDFSRSKPPENVSDASIVMASVSKLKDGDLSDVLQGADGSFLIYLNERTIATGDEAEKDKQTLAEQIGNMDSRFLFQSWFDMVRSEADPRRPLDLDMGS